MKTRKEIEAINLELKFCKTNLNYSKTILYRTMFFGFLLRCICLFLILVVFSKYVSPYLIFDDVEYENVALNYIKTATSIIDKSSFANVGGAGYLQPFWPWITCIFGYIFRTQYAARFLNIILSTLNVILVYKLAFEVSNSDVVSMKAAKITSYLPIFILISCFNIKDIYIMTAIIYSFWILVKFDKMSKVKIYEIILMIALMFGAYLSRGAIVEMMIIFYSIVILKSILKRKKYIIALLSIIIVAVVAFLLKDRIIGAFYSKINDYISSGRTSTSISFVRIDSISQIYKLPLTYAFATIQPFSLNLFNLNGITIWMQIINFLNVTIIPIAVGNFIYIFIKKDNLTFWLTTIIMFSSIIILSLGVFRHYFFLMPVEIINYSCCSSKKIENLDFIGVIVMFIFVLLVLLISISRI